MTKRIRIAIALVFTAVFITTAPVVLLYTAGYRYDWQKGRFQKTGQVSAETIPKDATVSLNGVPRGTTPLIATRLLPDDYAVRIEKTGYLPWQKTLGVRSGETTFAKDVLLFRDLLPELVHRDEIAAAAFSARGDAAVIATRSGGDEILMLRQGSADADVVARFPPGSGRDMTLSWSPDASAFLVSTADASSRGIEATVYPVDPGNAAAILREILTDLPPAARIDSARWTGGGAEIIAATSVGTYAFDIRTGATIAITNSPNDDAFAIDDTVFVLEPSSDRSDTGVPTQTIVRSIRGGVPTELLTLRGRGYRILAATSAWLVVGDGGNPEKCLLIDREKKLAIHTFTASHALAEPKKNGRLLLWSDMEISVFDPRTESRETIVRIGTPIGNALWHPLGMHVLYETGGTVSAVELDGRNGRNTFLLVPGSAAEAFALDPSGAAIMFAGTVGSRSGIYVRGL